jgi:hypothetical protein
MTARAIGVPAKKRALGRKLRINLIEEFWKCL